MSLKLGTRKHENSRVYVELLSVKALSHILIQTSLYTSHTKIQIINPNSENVNLLKYLASLS